MCSVGLTLSNGDALVGDPVYKLSIPEKSLDLLEGDPTRTVLGAVEQAEGSEHVYGELGHGNRIADG